MSGTFELATFSTITGSLSGYKCLLSVSKTTFIYAIFVTLSSQLIGFSSLLEYKHTTHEDEGRTKRVFGLERLGRVGHIINIYWVFSYIQVLGVLFRIILGGATLSPLLCCCVIEIRPVCSRSFPVIKLELRLGSHRRVRAPITCLGPI